MKVAFVTGPFPQFGETFIVNQIADLIDRKIDISVWAFEHGDARFIHGRYAEYHIADRVTYLDPPRNILLRYLIALPLIVKVLFFDPGVLSRALSIKRFGRNAFSLRYLFWAAPFIGQRFDVIHCNYGPIANRYLVIREILGDAFLATPIVTTFYGFDASLKLKEKGPHYYDELKKIGTLFFTMSEEMKQRLVTIAGFDPDKVISHPVSIDVPGILYSVPEYTEGDTIEIVSVGRFVEKKGFDDLLRAAAILKKKTSKPFRITIVGGGPLEHELKELATELGVLDVVRFTGRMQPEDILTLHRKSHLYVQASKTAANGDME